MNKKHPKNSKSIVESPRSQPGSMKESDKKKLELGDAMEHEHGQTREETEEDVEELDGGGKHAR